MENFKNKFSQNIWPGIYTNKEALWLRNLESLSHLSVYSFCHHSGILVPISALKIDKNNLKQEIQFYIYGIGIVNICKQVTQKTIDTKPRYEIIYIQTLFESTKNLELQAIVVPKPPKIEDFLPAPSEMRDFLPASNNSTKKEKETTSYFSLDDIIVDSNLKETIISDFVAPINHTPQNRMVLEQFPTISQRAKIIHTPSNRTTSDTIEIPQLPINTPLPRIWPQQDHNLEETFFLPHNAKVEFKFSGYKVLNKIADYGFGEIYRGIKRATNDFVTIELLKGIKIQKHLHEITACASVSHPNILNIHQVVQEKGVLYLVRTNCDVQSLSQYIKEHCPSLRKQLLILLYVAHAVETCHQAGVIHGAISFSNIVVDKDGKPYLINFGLEKFAKSLKKSPQFFRYMAPEQFLKRRGTSISSDVYSLATILYELVAEKPAVNEEKAARIRRQITSQYPIFSKSFPNELKSICYKGFVKLPSKRYSSAALFAKDLQCFLDSQPISAKTVKFIHIQEFFLQHAKTLRTTKKIFQNLAMVVVVLLLLMGINSFQKWHQNAKYNSMSSFSANLLYARDKYTRASAAKKIISMGDRGAIAIPSLIEALQDEQWMVRENVIKALKAVDPSYAQITPYLIKALRHENQRRRNGAAEALSYLVIHSKEVKVSLLQALSDEYWPVRKNVIYALEKISDTEIENHLVKKLEDPNWVVRRTTVEVLSKINYSKYLEKMIDIATVDRDEYVREYTFRLIKSRTTNLNNSIIPYLLKALDIHKPEIQEHVMEILGKIRPISADTLPLLIENLNSRNFAVSKYAREALSQLDTQDPKTWQLVQEYLKNQKQSVREDIIKALIVIRPKDNQMIPILVMALQDQSAFVRRFAADALGETRFLAVPALGDLEQALRIEQSSFVKASIERAIKAIRGK